MYGVHDYDAMFADAVRTQAYHTALANAIRPGDVVVEIGTGVGYFAIAACRAGARHVYALELNSAVALGPELAMANGCAGQITFLHGHSRHLTLPERGDVFIEDLRGILPLHGDRIPSILDARDRLLHPGARFVTIRDTLWAAPCEADARFRERHLLLGDWPYGVDRRVVDRRVREAWYRASSDTGRLLAPPACWGTLAYESLVSPDISGEAAWTIAQGGRAEGLLVWFDAELAGGTTFSNAPGLRRNTVYGQAFFPLTRPLDLCPGDRLTTTMLAKFVPDDYVFGWDTVLEPADPARSATRFRQSNLAALASTQALLHGRRDGTGR